MPAALAAMGGANDDVVSKRFSRPPHLASRRDASFVALTYRWCSLRSTTG